MTQDDKLTFVWDGVDRHGARTRGELIARTVAQANLDLRRQGIRPIRVKRKPKALLAGFDGTKKVRSRDLTLFTRQLATMLISGIPLVQAFQIMGSSSGHRGMRELIGKIKADVESGNALHEALEKHPKQFDTLYTSLVNAGEQAGALEKILKKLADYKERTDALVAKVKKAMIYPAAVVVVALVVTAILLIFVIPTFEDLFKAFGAQLPAFTQLVLNLSKAFRAGWWILLLTIAAVVIVFRTAMARSERFNYQIDRLMLRIPVLGPITNKSAIARFARTLATMSAAGVPLVEALRSVAGATGNRVYTKAVLSMRDQIATGQQLQQSMRETALFPPMAVQMVGIGEEAGSLDGMLDKIADFFEDEVNNMVEALNSLLEPIIIAVLGTLVGGLVIAMYLPIFKLGSVI